MRHLQPSNKAKVAIGTTCARGDCAFIVDIGRQSHLLFMPPMEALFVIDSRNARRIFRIRSGTCYRKD